MDAAQMLTAQEIARQCEQMARTAQREKASSEPRNTRQSRPAEPGAKPVAQGEWSVENTVSELDTAEAPVRGDAESVVATADHPVSRSGALSAREREILAFERQWWKRAGSKEQSIRELFGLSQARYCQILNELADKPAAFREDPMLIKRLRKVRSRPVRGAHRQSAYRSESESTVDF